MRRTDWTLKWEWPLWLVEFVNLQNYMMFLKAEQLVMWNNVKQKHVSPRRCGPGCDVNYHPCKWNMYKYICLSMQSMRLAPILRGTPCHLHSRCQDRPQAHHHLKAGAAVPTYLFFVQSPRIFSSWCCHFYSFFSVSRWVVLPQLALGLPQGNFNIPTRQHAPERAFGLGMANKSSTWGDGASGSNTNSLQLNSTWHGWWIHWRLQLFMGIFLVICRIEGT